MITTILWVVLAVYATWYALTRLIVSGVIIAAIFYTKEKKSSNDKLVLAGLYLPLLPEIAMLFITYILGE